MRHGKHFIGLLLLGLVLGGCASFSPSHVSLMTAQVKPEAVTAPRFDGVCVRVWGGAYRYWEPLYGLTFQHRLVCVKDKNHIIDFRPILAQDLKSVLPGAEVILGGQSCPGKARVVDVYFRSEFWWFGRRVVPAGITFFTVAPVSAEKEEPPTGEDVYKGFLSKGYVNELRPPLLTTPTQGLHGPERWMAKALGLVAVYVRQHLAETLHQKDLALDQWVLEHPAQSKPDAITSARSWWWWAGYKVKVKCPGDPLGTEDPFSPKNPYSVRSSFKELFEDREEP